jgi:hypothetical protein
MDDATPVPDDIDVEFHRATQDEMEERRSRVLSMRIRANMTATAIAKALHVSVVTVCRDIEWIYANWRGKYGLLSKLAPADIVGEAVAAYDEAERLAWSEFMRVAEDSKRPVRESDGNGGTRVVKDRDGNVVWEPSVSPAFIAKQRMVCVRMAVDAREKKMALMQDLGIVERRLGEIQFNLPPAHMLRESMRKALAERQPIVSDAERAIIVEAKRLLPPALPLSEGFLG